MDASTRRMLDAFETFKRDKEADEIRTWRHATAAKRWRAIAELMDLGETIIRSRPTPYVHERLSTGWLPPKAK